MRFKLFLLAVVLIALSTNAFAAPGDLDPTFNGTGRLLTNIAVNPNAPLNMLEVQPDGKILVGANLQSFSSNPDTVIMRYNPNGTLDTAFGSGGTATINTTVTSGWQRGYSLALQPDGKILMTGDANGLMPVCATVRLNANGTIDTSFNGSGARQTSFHLGCFARSVRSQSDGKVVVGGFATDMNQQSFPTAALVTIRYNANGTIDTGYNGNGISATAFLIHTYGSPRALLIQSDNKILLGFSKLDPTLQTDAHFGMVRFNTNGSFDTAFGTGGTAFIGGPGTFEVLADAGLQPDGKIAVVGYRDADFTLARFNTDGSQDMSFGSGGYTVSTESAVGASSPEAILVQPNGKILAGGVVKVSGVPNFGIIRYNPDGSLDNARPAFSFESKQSESVSLWSTNGIATANFGGTSARIHSMAFDPAGRVLASGSSQSTTGYLALARFQGDASPYAGIYGTIRTAGGIPIRSAQVIISGGSLAQPIVYYTNNFGLYYFPDLPVTETYTIKVSAKRFRFTQFERSVMINSDVANFDFTANPQE